MDSQNPAPTLRKGKFLSLDTPARKAYLEELRERICEGYYFTDCILSRVAEELTPILAEVVGAD